MKKWKNLLILFKTTIIIGGYEFKFLTIKLDKLSVSEMDDADFVEQIKGACMYLTKWDPFETLSNLENEIDTGFSRMLRPSRFRTPLKNSDFPSFDWLPSVDIKESKESYEFDVEVPGMDKDQIKVFVSDNNILNIKGERKKETEKKEENYHRIEREYGSFARSFSLPENIDASKVNAEYKNGILKVTLAKKEIAKPKEIPVKAA